MKALFLNEGIGGNATMHRALRIALDDRPDVEATFLDVPKPRLARKLVAAPVPGLARFDLDLQPLRYQLAQSAHVRRLIRQVGAPAQDADVVHVYTHNAVLLSVGWLRRKPLVVSLDGTTSQNAYHLPYRYPSVGTPFTAHVSHRLERRVHDAASLVVAKSEWAAQSLRDGGVDPDKIRVLPFGITAPPESAIGWAHDGVRVTFVGSTLARKGGYRLLRVWRDRLRGRCTLTMVTGDPLAPEPGLEVVNDARPGDGKVDEILARTDVFVFPTEIDNFGYAPLEAMAAGVPVVASSVNAVPELVDDGNTGLLYPVLDDRRMGDAIEALVSDVDRRRRMGAAGRRRVLERFDARVTTVRLIELLDEARHRFAVSV
ncbi:MAG: alpha-maltose-phosphate synthase [Actinomycetota bacterium]|nr:alpha-maltose-phosphate synthase [Actinomycetota bacterium]